MSAEAIARALDGHRAAGATWMARCPAHDDRTPSLAIREGRDGRVLLKCHAGCAQWDVIGALRDRGIWMPGSGRSSAVPPRIADIGEHRGDGGDRGAFALQIWADCIPARATLVETYLRGRGLVLPAPASLRFHPALKHPSGALWPAMVALVTRGTDGVPVGIHRTFLARDGAGKAPVTPAKMMLGRCGGGVVRLAEAADTLMVGEGIETTLSVMQVTGQPAWAALSTSGLRALNLPPEVREVVLLADGDEPGGAAARHAARRWVREGRSARIARAPAGKDFNDLLIGELMPAGGAR
jgi:hypothetical protein